MSTGGCSSNDFCLCFCLGIFSDHFQIIVEHAGKIASAKGHGRKSTSACVMCRICRVLMNIRSHGNFRITSHPFPRLQLPMLLPPLHCPQESRLELGNMNHVGSLLCHADEHLSRKTLPDLASRSRRWSSSGQQLFLVGRLQELPLHLLP